MKIICCTTCKGRLEHLRETLPRNMADNPRAHFLVLDYNSKDGCADWVSQWIAESNLRFANHGHSDGFAHRTIVYRFTEPGPFRMAHAKNLAHRCAIAEGADIVVNLDADNFTGPGFANFLADNFTADSFFYVNMVKEGPDRMPRGVNGRIAVTRTQFLLSGGYDEQYDTWSPDDKDFNARLRRLGFPARIKRRKKINDRRGA